MRTTGHEFPDAQLYGVAFDHDGTTFPKEWPSEIHQPLDHETVADYARRTNRKYSEMSGAELNELRATLQDKLDAVHAKMARDQFEQRRRHAAAIALDPRPMRIGELAAKSEYELHAHAAAHPAPEMKAHVARLLAANDDNELEQLTALGAENV